MDVGRLFVGLPLAARHMWRVALVLVLAGVGAGALVTEAVPATYRATAAIHVTDVNGGGTGILAEPQYLATPNRLASQTATFAGILTAPMVLQPVAATLGGTPTESHLRHEVSASTSGSDGLIQIHVIDRDAATAARYANAVAARFASVLDTVSRDSDGAATISVHQVVTAQVPGSSVAAPWVRNLAFGGLAGLMLALFLAGSCLRLRRADEERLVPLL
jgi:capsular polysaccharide biosynthesis protein